MPTVSTPYTPDFKVPEQLQRDRDAALSCAVLRAGVAVVVVSGNLQILRPDGSELHSAAIVVGPDSEATLTVAAAVLAAEPFQWGYSFYWTLTLTGTPATQTFRNTGGIVRVHPSPPAHVGSILERRPNLNRRLAGLGQASWQPQLDSAWWALQRWLIAKGNRPNLLVEPSELLELHRAWSMWLIYDTLAENADEDEVLSGERDRFEAALDRIRKTVTFRYADGDELQTADDPRSARGSVFLGNGDYVGGWGPADNWRNRGGW